MKQIKSFIENLKKDRRIETFDEAATKQAVIIRILSFLGWDAFNIDEVTPEYTVSSQRIDYALRIHHTNKVFIEVKKISEELEKHQEQLLSYSFQEGVKLAVLTNGISWWFYLPLNEGSWEQRKFYTIDIFEQKSEDISEKFKKLLTRENVESGKSLSYAEKIYHNQQKRQFARKSLPKAWNKLIEEPDELLIELLGETAERLSGYKTDLEVVAEFMRKHQMKLLIPEEKSYRHVNSKKSTRKRKSSGLDEDYTGKNIIGFEFQNQRVDVYSWRDFLILVCELIYQKHPTEFDRVLELKGRKRPYFSQNSDVLRDPAPIGKSGIFTETNLSANDKVKRVYQVLSMFKYNQKYLKIYLS